MGPDLLILVLKGGMKYNDAYFLAEDGKLDIYQNNAQITGNNLGLFFTAE